MNRVIKNRFSIVLAERHLKISYVARDTGISRTTLTNLYYDRNKSISINVLEKLCKYLKCTINDIFEIN